VCRPDVFTAHLRLRERQARSLADIEAESFGVTHARLGAYFLSLWGFPLEIVEAAAHHTSVPPLELGPLSAAGAVHLAHQLVESERIGLCGAPGHPGVPDAVLESASVLDEVRAWRAEPAASRQEGAA